MSTTCAVCGFEDNERCDLCANCQHTLPGGVGLWLSGRPKRGGEFAEGVDFVWKRSFGNFYTNVRWRVRHHSSTGMEIGYAGSGPADLALNVMAAIFPRNDGKGIEKCWDGRVSHTAWILHQKFKFDFLASADRDEGHNAWDAITEWIDAQRDELEEILCED